MTSPRDEEDTTPPRDPGADREGTSRRAFLRRATYGGAAVLGGGLLGRELSGSDAAAQGAGPYTERASIGGGGGPSGPLASARGGGSDGYGAFNEPPARVSPGDLDALTIPPPADGGPGGRTRELEMVVTARQVEVADGIVVDAWTYNGTAPGPIIRCTAGDTLRVRLRNLTDHAHNLHLHGRHAVDMDGWEPIPPGEEFTYVLTPGPVGFHPYHCHTPPLAMHIGKGLYGAVIVDPPGGRPPAHEVVLVLSGWDADGDGRNEVYAWNGIAGYFHKYPIKVPVGEPVRCYVLNMTEYEPVGGFHLHAETFDVFPSGTGDAPTVTTDTITLGQAERAICEFTLPERGRYMFHPHQHHIAEAGAMGWFAAI